MVIGEDGKPIEGAIVIIGEDGQPIVVPVAEAAVVEPEPEVMPISIELKLITNKRNQQIVKQLKKNSFLILIQRKFCLMQIFANRSIDFLSQVIFMDLFFSTSLGSILFVITFIDPIN